MVCGWVHDNLTSHSNVSVALGPNCCLFITAQANCRKKQIYHGENLQNSVILHQQCGTFPTAADRKLAIACLRGGDLQLCEMGSSCHRPHWGDVPG